MQRDSLRPRCFVLRYEGVTGHVCRVNGDCQRFLELWNLVFIQYNRRGPSHLEPLPATHVDTGMGFERIVSVLQDQPSNYNTDLFTPLMDVIQELARHNDEEKEENLTPYRVIADHARAAAFLIADGVVPGNMGRNYICRMIIRRAARIWRKNRPGRTLSGACGGKSDRKLWPLLPGVGTQSQYHFDQSDQRRRTFPTHSGERCRKAGELSGENASQR